MGYNNLQKIQSMQLTCDIKNSNTESILCFRQCRHSECSLALISRKLKMLVRVKKYVTGEGRGNIPHSFATFISRVRLNPFLVIVIYILIELIFRLKFLIEKIRKHSHI